MQLYVCAYVPGSGYLKLKYIKNFASCKYGKATNLK